MIAIDERGQVWHCAPYQDGSTPPGKTNILCDAIEVVIAEALPIDVAISIAEAHNEALRPGSTGETEGWVLVPKEPTEAMAVCIHDDAAVARGRYRAMLAAAGGRNDAA